MCKFTTKHLYNFICELLISCFAIFCITSFFMRNSVVLDAVKQGLLLCYNTLIPSLFVFVILSKLLLNTRFAYVFGLPLLPYTKYVLNIKNKTASTALMLGLLGGFGTGAVCLNTLYEKKLINKHEAKILICAIINSGPAFVIAGVGGGMFNNMAIGFYIFISLCIASLICGLCAKISIKKGDENIAEQKLDEYTKKNTSGNKQAQTFADIVKEAVITMLNLCGFAVFFSFVIGVLFSPSLNSNEKTAIAILFEVTNASYFAASLNGLKSIYLCCIALSFMGISVFLQVRSIINKEISLVPLLVSRIIHIVISLFVLYLLFKLFPLHISVFFMPQNARLSMPIDAVFFVLFMCCCLFTFAKPTQRKLAHFHK